MTLNNRKDGGFSLAEMLIVVALIGLLVIITIPSLTFIRVSTGNQAIVAALNNVAGAINARIVAWRGVPPSSLGICNTEQAYPTSPAPANLCQPQTWNAARVATGGALIPPLRGTLPEGTTVQGHVDNIGRFCLDGASSTAGTDPWYLDSDMTEPAVGTCYSAGWTVNSSAITPDSGLAPAAPAPTGLFDAAAINGGKSIRWDATAGTQYLVTLEGQGYKTVTPSVTGTAECAFPSAGTTCGATSTGPLPAGTYLATVRQMGSNGWGAPATHTVIVE